MQILLNSQKNNPNFGLNIQNKSKVPKEIVIALKESGLEDTIDKNYPHAKAEYKKGLRCDKFVIDLGTKLKGILKRFNIVMFKQGKNSTEENNIASKIMNFNFTHFEERKSDLAEYVNKMIQIKNTQKIREFLKH